MIRNNKMKIGCQECEEMQEFGSPYAKCDRCEDMKNNYDDRPIECL